MVRAVEGHEAGPGDFRRQRPTGVEGDHLVASGVEHEGRTADPLHFGPDVDVAELVLEPGGDLRRRGLALKLVEPVDLLLRALGQEHRREDLAEGRVVPTPAAGDELDERLLPAPEVGAAAVLPHDHVAAVEYKLLDAFGVPGGVGDAERATLGGPSPDLAQAGWFRPPSA
jgi:hypothetical protein